MNTSSEILSPVASETAENRPETTWHQHLRRGALVVGISLGGLAAVGASSEASGQPLLERPTPVERVSDHYMGTGIVLDEIDLPEIGRDAVNGMRKAAPVALALGGSVLAGLALSRREVNRKKLTLAANGYSRDEHGPVRRLLRGAAVPAIGTLALLTSFSIEEEIREGPNRMIADINRQVENDYGDKSVSWLLEPGTDHLMNNSRILEDVTVETKTGLFEVANSRNIDLLPFHLELTDVEFNGKTQTSLALASPNKNRNEPSTLYPEVKSGATCELVANRCLLNDGEIVVDNSEGIKLGDKITIRDEEFEVVGFAAQPQSLLNRFVVFTGENSMQDLRSNPDAPYYGMLAAAKSEADVSNLLEEFSLQDDVQMLSKAQLLEQNADFWEGNGTALTMLLILNIGVFGGISMYERKRAEQEQNRANIATLRSMGMSVKDVVQIEAAKSVIETVKGFPVALPVALLVSKVANAGITGFHSEITAPMAVAAAGTVLASKLAGDALLSRKLRKISPAEHLE